MLNDRFFNKNTLSNQTSEEFEWRKWRTEIPFLNFPPEWLVKVIPPISGAVVRFWVTLPELDENDIISVYLDCYSQLGCMDEPYWEIYPNSKGDCSRFFMSETKKLLKSIQSSLNKLKKKALKDKK